MPIKVILADDHALIRQSLRTLLEREGFQVLGEASDGHEAVRLAAQVRPEVAILDIAMPTLNGVDAARELAKLDGKPKAILLTRHDEDQYVIESLRAGVRGYVLKTQAATDLVQAIRQVSRGEIYLSPGISGSVVQAFLAKEDLPLDPLSSRERQVLQLICEGRSTKQVAGQLGISVKTAESHRTRLMQKLNIHETASLVRYAIRRGLVQP